MSQNFFYLGLLAAISLLVMVICRNIKRCIVLNGERIEFEKRTAKIEEALK